MSETARFIHDTQFGICIGIDNSADPNNITVACSFVNAATNDTYNRKIGRSIVRQRILSADIKDTPYVTHVSRKRFEEESVYSAWVAIHEIYFNMLDAWDEAVPTKADNLWEEFENRLLSYTSTNVKVLS